MIAIVYLVKATVIVLTAATAIALGRRRASSGTRHFICTLAIGGLLTLPLLSSALPGWTTISLSPVIQKIEPILDTETGHTTSAGAPAGRTAAAHHTNLAAARTGSSHSGQAFSDRPGIPWPVVLLALYLGGVCLFLVRLAVDHLTIRRLLRRTTEMTEPEWQALLVDCAHEIGVRNSVRLFRHPDGMPPMTIGIRRAAIVLPALADGWSDEVRRVVLLHELAHVARRDCLTQAGAALACALYWIHPGSWWLARRLRVDRELACDDVVLSTGISAPEYGRHLLDVAYRLGGEAPPALAAGMSRASGLETRLFALLDGSRKRAALTSRGRAAVVALCALLMVAIAAPTTPAAQPDDQVLTKAAADADRYIVRRFLNVDHWRHVAIGQLTRMADQLQYLNDMRQLGYSVADVPSLFTLRRHGVTPDYVRRLAAEGLSGLSTAELLAAVRQGVTAGYVRDMKSLVDQTADVESLVRLRRHGIDGDFIRELDAVGFQHMPVEALLQTRRHGISGEYIRGFQALGYDWTIDDLVRARSHGVDAEYVEAVAAQGHPRVPLDDLVRLRSHGITSARIKAANERAGTVVPVDLLVHLASHGWK
jgi:beta-lactamase regulating signal transducer with metallopeptidase domain